MKSQANGDHGYAYLVPEFQVTPAEWISSFSRAVQCQGVSQGSIYWYYQTVHSIEWGRALMRRGEDLFQPAL